MDGFVFKLPILPFLTESVKMKLAIAIVGDFPATSQPAHRFQNVTLKGSFGAISRSGNQKNYEQIQANQHKS